MTSPDPFEVTGEFDSASREAATRPSDAEPPEFIGRYRVEGVLGEGGFGVVYRATDEQLHRSVAVKVPHRRLVASAGDAASYLVEARTVANLDHPQIVPVYDVGSSDDFPCYIVSKYIDGMNLAAKLEQQRFSPARATRLVATIADALHHAHQQGLVHRDVKPGNILIDGAGNPFLVDFGLALREEDGLFDMLGNIGEWTADPIFDDRVLIARPTYATPAAALAADDTAAALPNTRFNSYGFRIVRTRPAPAAESHQE